MAHPQHPHCDECKKALFKSPIAAKVKPADPYAYCRNSDCKQYTFRRLLVVDGFDPKRVTADQLDFALKVAKNAPEALERAAPKKSQTAGHFDEIASKSTKKRPKVVAHPETSILVPEDTRPSSPKPVSKRGRARSAVPASAVPPKPTEPEPIAKARRRLKDILAEVVKGHPREAAGLVLAILSQETGNQRAAEALIDEYKLDTKFGLQKFADHR